MDERVPEHTDSHASSSHEVSLESTTRRREELGKHSVYTHFPKDRNYEICKLTKIASSPCRRLNGEAALRADNFGDLITADHKVLSDNCESRNNHRYAVVVQDLVSQWIHAHPCKNKTSQETQRSLQKFLEPERKPKVIYTDNSLEFGKACEDRSWNHCTSTPHRSETNGIAERAMRRVKEGTSAVLQLGLNVGGQNLWNVAPMCETSQIYCLMGRRPMKDVLGNHLEDLLFHLVPCLSVTRANLVVLAAEMGGRWSTEAAQFIRALAASKAASAPEFMQVSVAHAWWRRLLACSATKAFAGSLLEHRSPVSAAGVVPSVHDVIRDGLHVR